MMRQRVLSAIVRYTAAVVAVGIVLVIKLLLIPVAGQDAPFLLFFVAVMVAAWSGGLGPGLLATALATFCNFYFFMQPFEQFALSRPDQPPQLGLFCVEGLCISLICAKLKLAVRRAEENAKEARELEARLLEVSDAEQRRIGHDLHDGLGQHLTGISLLSRHLENQLVAGHSPQAPEAARLSELAKSAVEWTHDLCRSLSPPALERNGLSEALRELASNAQVIFNIQCSFDDEPAAAAFHELAPSVHLYRIAQEAISNAVKHGRAKNVSVRLSLSGHDLLLEVKDDGVGMCKTNDHGDGMGLRIMRYRAMMIGASIGVNQPAGEGTTVTCRYALRSNGSEQSAGAANGQH
jgi:signal transduction histidine kinase